MAFIDAVAIPNAGGPRKGCREHEHDLIWQAQEKYCADRMTFKAIARETGIAASTLKRWSAKYEWSKVREELSQAKMQVRLDTLKARKQVLEKLLTSDDGKEASQLSFAFASLERLDLEQKKFLQSLKPAKEEIARELPSLPEDTTEEERLELLQTAVNRQIAYILAHPVDNLSTRIKDIKAGLDALAQIKGKDDAEQNVLQVSFMDACGVPAAAAVIGQSAVEA
jgi:transposase-like protein